MAAAAENPYRAGSNVADATHELYGRYGRQIYAYCLHHLRSREEAEDAVQTTFLNAFRGLQRGTTTHNDQAWLYKIAQNVCFARSSSSGRRLKLETPNDFEKLQEIVPARESGDSLELMGLEQALEKMPENQRRAILLREWQGLSYREIARELQLSQSAVEMLIFRARRTLAKALEAPEAEPRSGKGQSGVSLGGLVAAMKSLFNGVVAVKMAAVAVSAAVVTTTAGEGVVHRITHEVTHVTGAASVHPSSAAKPSPRVSASPAAHRLLVTLRRPRTVVRPAAPVRRHSAPPGAVVVSGPRPAGAEQPEAAAPPVAAAAQVDTPAPVAAVQVSSASGSGSSSGGETHQLAAQPAPPTGSDAAPPPTNTTTSDTTTTTPSQTTTTPNQPTTTPKMGETSIRLSTPETLLPTTTTPPPTQSTTTTTTATTTPPPTQSTTTTTPPPPPPATTTTTTNDSSGFHPGGHKQP